MLERASVFAPTIVHGFTTREGGVSEGRHATLNLGGRCGDSPTHMQENLRRVAERAGFQPGRLRLAKQVHGANVVRAVDIDDDTQADALWHAREHGPMIVGVLTADCVPVLLADQARGVVAAIHSGWRGTVANVVGTTLDMLVVEGAQRARIVAAIGPCIRLDAFEVGPDVAEQFPPACVRREPGKPHVDLVAAVTAQLVEGGVSPERIECVGGCTFQASDRYFSYRRDGAKTGQQLSFIGFR